MTVESEKVQFLLETTQRDVNLAIKKRLVLAQVTETERFAILRAIRWSFISHDQLVEISMDSDFDAARAMILEGLSSRLVKFEETTKVGSSLLNMLPRNCLQDGGNQG